MRPLIDADYVPFAQWSDGWGPICFDHATLDAASDSPIVWMDHEALVSLNAEQCRQRACVLLLAQPLYASCREFLLDVFGRS